MQDEIAPHPDQMSLSKLSSTLSSLQADSQERSATLARLSSAIDADAYQVDALGVSNSLISGSLK